MSAAATTRWLESEHSAAGASVLSASTVWFLLAIIGQFAFAFTVACFFHLHFIF